MGMARTSRKSSCESWMRWSKCLAWMLLELFLPGQLQPRATIAEGERLARQVALPGQANVRLMPKQAISTVPLLLPAVNFLASQKYVKCC